MGAPAKKKPELTPKQAQFVREYLVDLNATQAAIRAGYSPRTAESQGSTLLRNPKVRACLEVGRARLAQAVEVTQERVLQELARLGFLDPRRLFNPDGSPKPIQDLDDDTAAALAGLDVMEVYEGQGENRAFVGYLKKYKLADKKGALDSIAKHLGMFVERKELTGKDGGPIQIEHGLSPAVQELIDALKA